MRSVGLIGALVAAAIIVGAVVYLFASPPGTATGSQPAPRADGKGTTVIGRPAFEAKDEVCKSNLGNVRLSIQTKTDPVENTFPQSIEELGLPQSTVVCPIDKVPYEYDPQTGTARCPHPGHESY